MQIAVAATAPFGAAVLEGMANRGYDIELLLTRPDKPQGRGRKKAAPPAKEVASLDFLSGGRFLFGIGGGWNAEEMEEHGTPFRKRWRVLRERVLAMKKIWTEETPSPPSSTRNASLSSVAVSTSVARARV